MLKKFIAKFTISKLNMSQKRKIFFFVSYHKICPVPSPTKIIFDIVQNYPSFESGRVR